MIAASSRVSISKTCFPAAVLLFCLAAGTALAEVKLPRYIQFTVQSADGYFFPIGEAEFCTPDGECSYADIEKGFPGHFYLDTDDLEAGQSYSIKIYEKNLAVPYEINGWTFRPKDFDPLYDPRVGIEKFLVYPRFQGTEDGELIYRLDTTLNPEWVERKNMPRFTGPDTLPDHPRILAKVGMPIMLGGKFGTDDHAIGGVDDVRPGISLGATWRNKYPRHPPELDNWIPFHEWGVTYAQNRYEVWEIVAPGRRSDVTFHRLHVHYGFGRMDQEYENHWSLGAQVGLAGVFDGADLLEYEGTSYGRLGAGAYANLIRRMFEVGRVDVALSLRTECLYYLADSRPDDFWFGLAPTISLGLVVF